MLHFNLETKTEGENKFQILCYRLASAWLNRSSKTSMRSRISASVMSSRSCRRPKMTRTIKHNSASADTIGHLFIFFPLSVRGRLGGGPYITVTHLGGNVRKSRVPGKTGDVGENRGQTGVNPWPSPAMALNFLRKINLLNVGAGGRT
jgi:hypothetical protein